MNRSPYSAGPKGEDNVCPRFSIPAYLDVHPLKDYEPVGRAGGTWVGSYRGHAGRHTVMVQQLHQTSLSDFRMLARVAHPNIAHPIALYIVGEEVHVAYEYVELNVFDLPLPSQLETAAIMAQVRC